MTETATTESEKHAALHRSVLTPWSVQGRSPEPVMVRGEGSYLFDVEGRRYLDLTSGYVTVNLGHSHPAVVAAMQEQAARLCWAPPMYVNDVRAAYASELTNLLPWRAGARVHFTCGGAEANDDAVKIARLATGRAKILSAYRSYHGGTIGASSLTGVDRHRDRLPGLTGVVHFFTPYLYRSPFHATDEATESERALEHLERVLLHEGSETVAAIVLEPVVGSSAIYPLPQSYLAGVREIATRHGIVLIFDEVMSGFGRVGDAFASIRLGVEPDLLVFAKGASSGYAPLGGVVVREEVASVFDRELFDVGHTNAGHVFAVATGRAVLEAYREERLFERAYTIETWLRAGLGALHEKHEIIGDVRGLGALFGLELVSDRESREPFVEWHAGFGLTSMRAFYESLLQRGVHAYGRYNLVLVAPPLTISESELADGLEALDAALGELR
jgi:taurine--2-oxoglutarate transaminase